MLFLGRDAVDDRVIQQLRDRLRSPDKRKILNQLTGYPSWAQDVLRQVAATD